VYAAGSEFWELVIFVTLKITLNFEFSWT